MVAGQGKHAATAQNTSISRNTKYRNDAKQKTQTPKTHATEKHSISSQHNGSSPGHPNLQHDANGGWRCRGITFIKDLTLPLAFVKEQIKYLTIKCMNSSNQDYESGFVPQRRASGAAWLFH